MEERTIMNSIKKMRYLPWIGLLVVAGVALALLGDGAQGNPPAISPAPTLSGTQAAGLDARLAEILSLVDGAGSVDVLITRSDDAVAAGSFETGGDQYVTGVIVVAEGAESYEVRLILQQAVRAATGLPLSRIEVLPRASADQEGSGDG